MFTSDEREEILLKIVHISPQNFEKYRHPMLAFVRRYADDVNSYKWLFQLKRQQLEHYTTKIILALWNGKIIAILALSNFGIDHSIFLIAPQYKYPLIGMKLLEIAKKELTESYIVINMNEQKLIKMAHEAGYVSFYGKPKNHDKMYLQFRRNPQHKDEKQEKALNE